MNTQYLESKILTATPPRLHLMLLEGALRNCAVAQQAGNQEFWGEFDAAVGKAMDIVEELVRSVAGKQTDISESLEEQYAFLFRELAVGRIHMDLGKLASCVKLLELHRETWKLICEKAEPSGSDRPAVLSTLAGGGSSLPTEQLSLEA